jgi:hypothetical protein
MMMTMMMMMTISMMMPMIFLEQESLLVLWESGTKFSRPWLK